MNFSAYAFRSLSKTGRLPDPIRVPWCVNLEVAAVKMSTFIHVSFQLQADQADCKETILDVRAIPSLLATAFEEDSFAIRKHARCLTSRQSAPPRELRQSTTRTAP